MFPTSVNITYWKGLLNKVANRKIFICNTKYLYYIPTAQRQQRSFQEIEDLFRFPCELQEKILEQNIKAQKIGICRETPAARKRVFWKTNKWWDYLIKVIYYESFI